MTEKEGERERETGSVVSLCVNVLIERDESVERETMKMQSHCAPFIHISAALTLPTSVWIKASFTFQLFRFAMWILYCHIFDRPLLIT